MSNFQFQENLTCFTLPHSESDKTPEIKPFCFTKEELDFIQGDEKIKQDPDYDFMDMENYFGIMQLLISVLQNIVKFNYPFNWTSKLTQNQNLYILMIFEHYFHL